MKKQLLIATGLVLGSMASFAQCPTQTINGDLIINQDILMGGTYIVNGTFKVNAGVTAFVQPFYIDSCGSLKIQATKVDIQGNINADYSGYTGGTPGAGGATSTSPSGHQNAITSCVSKDNDGQVNLAPGTGGSFGMGPGGGLAGGNGTVGSGPKQKCTNNDQFGMIAGSGGAGAGSGGSYGGFGANGGNGGKGSKVYTISGMVIATGYTPLEGNGGLGGQATSSYGTISGTDIDLGSGGAGAGGGGRSFYIGSNGNRGGNGGGAITIIATDSLLITGTISANGEDGLAGGAGGNGDKTSDCCEDICNDIGERTFSAGAGGGGGAGAGSGGGIYIEAPLYSAITGTISVAGGNGGNGGAKGAGTSASYSNWACGDQSISTGAGNDGNKGGDGSGGRIKIFTTDCAENILAANLIYNGGSSADSGSYHSGVTACYFDNTSNQEFVSENAFNVFPNPATDVVYIKLQNSQFENLNTLSIFDLSGRLIFNKSIQGQGENTLQLPVSQFATGSYIIVLENAKGRSSQKLIKY